MARKEKYRHTGKFDGTNGAEWVEIDVKVKDKTVTAVRRLFTSVDQLGDMPDADLLLRVNYAEDLLARAACTRANTDEVGKKAQRTAARDAWKRDDKAGFIQFFVEESHSEAEINARLEAYYAENLAE